MSTITPLQAIRLTHSVLLKQLITKGRLIGIAIVGVLPILLGWVIGVQSNDPLEAGVGFVSYMGLIIRNGLTHRFMFVTDFFLFQSG